MRGANAERGTLLFENVMKRFWIRRKIELEDRRMTHHAQPGLVRRLRTDERGPEDSLSLIHI